jgi:hypothetical protein
LSFSLLATMDALPRGKWVETLSKSKSQASQKMSNSQTLVGNIPAAPQPAKTQLHESRWANNTNLSPQLSSAKPLTIRPNGISYNLPKQATEQVQDASTGDDLHGKARQETATEGPVDTMPNANSHGTQRQVVTTATEESLSTSAVYKVPPHLRHTVGKSLPPSRPSLKVGQSARRPSLLTTEALNAAVPADEEITKKHGSDDAAERASPVPTVTQSVIANVEDDTPRSMVPDIRGEEPVEILDDQDWDAPRRTRRKGYKNWDLESAGSGISGFVPSTYLTRYVNFWLEAVPTVETDFLGIPDNELHDVDPATGKLLAEIHQPRILKDASSEYFFLLYNPQLTKLLDRGVQILRLDQKMAQTSATKILEKMGKLKRQAEKKQRLEKIRLMDQQELELREEMAQRVNPWLCRIPAYLRPASIEDMEAVAAIYNQEVRYGWRSLDEKPVGLEAWRGIFNQCKTLKLPFVVALTEYRNPYIPIEQAGHKLMGFAFLDIASRGITGSINSSGKHSARLYVLVDPQYRRNRVGTALLDSVMSMASPSYHKKEDSYQFENPNMDPVYFPANKNPREYRTILIEVCVKNHGTKDDTAKGEEYQFIWNFLEGEFQTFLQSHAVSFGRCESQNPPVFLDRMIFEHQARVTAVTNQSR